MDVTIQELAKKYRIKPVLLEKWQKEGFIPFQLFSDKELDKDNKEVQDALHVYKHIAINRKKLANYVHLIDSLLLRNQKRVEEPALYLEQLNINALKNDLATFVDIAVSDTEEYKKAMKSMLLDKRLLYNALREFKQYHTHRRYWREEKWHLIDLELLNTERNALQKLYNELFPSVNKTYSTKLNFFPNQSPIQVSVEAKSREEAYALLKAKFPKDSFSTNDLVESNSTYNRSEGSQDTFDYLPDVEDPNYIETDPTKFV